jgi:hypothetical protein
MKLGRIVLAIVALCQLSASTGPSSPGSQPDYEVAENRYLELLRNSASDPKPMAHPQLAEAAASLFKPEAIALDFSAIQLFTDGSKKTTAGTIWYSKGRIFLEHTAIPDGETPWEYATVGDKLLGWKHGDSKVTSFKRYPGDTVDFLWYLADVSAIKASLHFMFLQKPDAFDARDSPPWRRLVLREPLEGFRELAIRASPLWLREVVYTIPTGEEAEVRMIVDPPRTIDALPARLESNLPKVQIEPIDWTIKSRMEFL